ncbi:CCA tRNA nucleotidyltransferase [Candidatus Gottesmanbacteria bacterium]|nr:CCA tRNA nucleotidyltransferase [Candidatus Gottesmanbacteria bacterium]
MKYQIPKEVSAVFNKFRKKGFEIFAVGGAVRNLILNKMTYDWDFTTNAQPEEIIKLFKESFYDNKFGTVGIPVKSLSSVFEITTYRSELGFTNHRHPDKIIWGKTLEEDLKRRDFTINTLVFDGSDIRDLLGGKTDLDNRLIKAVGDASERFQEDALRMLRAVRIATQLKFIIEPKTFAAIQKNNKLLNKISQERIRDELIKILSSEYPTDGILLLRNCGILTIILPELDACFGVEQKSPKRHHKYDVGTHLMESLRHCPSLSPYVRLATLLHDIGKPSVFNKTEEGVITFYNHEIIGDSMVKKIITRLHLSKKESEKISRLVKYHQFTVDERQTDKAVRRFIKNVGLENLKDILDLRIGDRLGGGATETSWRLDLFKKRLIEVQKQPFTISDLKIDGLDVMKILHLTPGPKVGEVLSSLYAKVIDGKIKNDRESLLTEIKAFFSSKTNLPKSPEAEQR